MSVYEFLSTGPLADLVVKRFRSHRSISADDLKVFAGELRVRLEDRLKQSTASGDLMLVEKEPIQRYLPELRRAIPVEKGRSTDDLMDVEEDLSELDQAAQRAAEAQRGKQLTKKRKTEESLQKRMERDRLKRKKRKKRRLARARRAEVEA